MNAPTATEFADLQSYHRPPQPPSSTPILMPGGAFRATPTNKSPSPQPHIFIKYPYLFSHNPPIKAPPCAVAWLRPHYTRADPRTLVAPSRLPRGGAQAARTTSNRDPPPPHQRRTVTVATVALRHSNTSNLSTLHSSWPACRLSMDWKRVNC